MYMYMYEVELHMYMYMYISTCVYNVFILYGAYGGGHIVHVCVAVYICMYMPTLQCCDPVMGMQACPYVCTCVSITCACI